MRDDGRRHLRLSEVDGGYSGSKGNVRGSTMPNARRDQVDMAEHVLNIPAPASRRFPAFIAVNSFDDIDGEFFQLPT